VIDFVSPHEADSLNTTETSFVVLVFESESRAPMNRRFLFLLCLFTTPVNAIDNGTDWMYLPMLGTSEGSARADSLGGAFVAIADDASAVTINPAGLHQLTRQHLLASFQYSNRDRYPGKTQDELFFFADQDHLGLSQLTYATPILNGAAALALYYQQRSLAHEDDFLGLVVESKTDVTTHDYGVGLAVPLFNDQLALGFAISYSRIDVDNQMTGSLLDASTSHDDFSSEATIHFGALWQVNDAIRIGVGFHRLPKFNYQSDYALAEALRPEPQTNCAILNTTQIRCRNQLNLPDYYAVGLSYQINDRWLASLEGRYIAYSQLLDDFRIIYPYEVTMQQANYDLDDQWRLHLGTEYQTQLLTMPVAWRFGYYHETYHGITTTGIAPSTLDRLVFDQRDDFHHWTVGLGSQLNPYLAVDVALDYAQDRYQALLTTTVTW
jgi:long-subunit fatty acid transport protein